LRKIEGERETDREKEKRVDQPRMTLRIVIV